MADAPRRGREHNSLSRSSLQWVGSTPVLFPRPVDATQLFDNPSWRRIAGTTRDLEASSAYGDDHQSEGARELGRRSVAGAPVRLNPSPTTSGGGEGGSSTRRPEAAAGSVPRGMFLGQGSPTGCDTVKERARVALPRSAGGVGALEKRPSCATRLRASPAVMSVSAIHASLQPSYRLPMVQGFQEQSLESVFQRNKNPNVSDLIILAAEVGLPVEAVKVWFEHRLARWRQSQGLPANWRMVNQ
ncbi:uncharacterized protein LOC115315265 [Ixodes scapularis]|uniref:uncharacterized protein LOC115315265 n=1 Tax=Ixodes scapularis TaxID=6945 RepID=UPI001C38C884|nr:uncharacterized protein LOC115315265 [Ixodes scapularis]